MILYFYSDSFICISSLGFPLRISTQSETRKMMLHHWLAQLKSIVIRGSKSAEFEGNGRTQNSRRRRNRNRLPSKAAIVELIEDRILLSALGTLSLVEAPAAGSDTDIVIASGAWSASTTASWISLNTTSGTGNGSVNFSFTADTGATRSGTVTIAGQTLTVTQAGSGYVAAGPATLAAASLTSLYCVAVDGSGNVYMADHNDNSIKEWHVATGTITTLVSTGLNNPLGVAVDGSGNVYIGDSFNGAIEEWHAATGTVTTLVSGVGFPQAVALDGSGNVYFNDGNAVREWQAATATVSTLTSGGNPYGLAVDGSGNVYIADGGTPAIKEWHAGTGTVTSLFNAGSGGNSGVAVDASGNVYVPDGNNNTINEWHVATGTITPLVSSGLTVPKCLAIDASGNIYVSSTGNNTVQEWKQSTATVTTIVSSVMAYPNGIAVDNSGNVYIADTGNSAIKEWQASTGTVITLVSTGLNPYGVAVDGSGNVYIADGSNNAIKKWNVGTGLVTTLVSSGLSNPTGVAVDSAGNVYIADQYNLAIKEWQVSNGSVTTLVSTGLSYPSGVALDSAGNVYIADSGNNAVKEWHVSSNSVTTLVSSGLSYPRGVAVDGSGNVYIGDGNHNAIQKWNAATGTVSTLISTGLKDPYAVAVDGSGNVYLANWNISDLRELPRAYVNTNLKSETSVAGTDQLSVIVPSTASLNGVFAPTSDQSWLTIGSVANDVVNFNFSANSTGSARTAHITLLGQTISVTQATSPPSVTTPTISSITNTSAVLGGNVTSDGGQTITERGVLYALTSVNSNPQLGGTGVTKVTATGTTGAFTVNATGLTQGSVYSFVAYATNGNGTAYSPLGPTFVPGPANVTGVYDPSSNPIAAGATLPASPNSLSASFSENMNSVTGGANSVTNPSNWLLFRYGVDVSYLITGITFAQNGTSLQYLATLSFATPLTQGGYQLIARQLIQDVSGRSLSGSAGTSPVDFRLNFYVGQPVGGTTDVAPYLYNIEPVALNATATVATPITSSLFVFDADSINWTSATVQIAINYQNGEDVLNFSNAATPNITASWNTTTGTLTLSGTDSVSDYRTALHNVTYTDISATPNTGLTRTVYFQANDGLLLSNLQTRDVTVMASSIPAVLSGVGGTGTYFQGYPAIALVPSLVISDPNTINLSSATVSFTNWQGEDRLNFNNIFADQWTFTQDLITHTATFTITGADLVDHYQTLLRSVIYWDVSGAPVTSARVASFSVTDGLSTSNVVTRNTIVSAVNQAPTLTSIEIAPLFCKANDPAYPAQPISNTLLVGDPDSNNLTKATVQITSGYENDANGNDVLAFTNQFGITGSFNATTGMLTLTGTSSVSNYRTALRSVTFGTSGTAPSTATRTLTIDATDDYTPTPATSLSATRTVTVQTTNLPPALSNIPNSPLAYVRNAAATAIAPGAVIYDPDSINLASVTIQVSGNYQSGLDVLAATVVTGITQSFNATTGTLTLSGVSSLANYQTVLQSVTFQTTSAANTLTRSISFTLNDGLANSSTVIRSVTLT